MRSKVPKRLATVTGSWPSAWTTVGEKTLAVLLCHLGINCVRLGLEHAAEDSVTGIAGGGFQVVQGGFWLEGGDSGCREIERGKLSSGRRQDRPRGSSAGGCGS